MEVINTSQISDPNKQQPFTGYSLEFLQNALRKDDAGIIEALVTKIVGSYSLTVPYVISGCVVSDSNKDVTAGTLFYGGKFYETTAVNGTTNVARFIKTKTQDATADPITFSDSSTGSVHDIYKYVPTDVASGGDFISTDLVYLTATVAKLYSLTTLATQDTSSTSYVDMTGLTYTTPNDGVTRLYLIQGKAVMRTPSPNGGEGGKMRIYNSTTTTQLDEGRCYMDVVATNTDLFESTVTVMTVQSLAPNTVIKCQFACVSSFISADVATMVVTEL